MTDWEEFLNTPYRVPKAKKAKKIDTTSEAAKIRYQQAHELDFRNQYPTAYKAGHYFKPKMPNCATSNGLQNAIQNYITWNGGRATRVSSAGRKVDGKWIPGTTRKGSADVSSTINGKSVMWEIKIGTDSASPQQTKEQQREIKAGGKYFFVKTFDEFLTLYDSL